MPDGRRTHCKLCDKIFNTQGSARNHLARIHYPRPVECGLCQMVQKSIIAFRVHIIQHHGIKGVKNVIETYGRVLPSQDYQTNYL
jgi:hypothetical protein